VARFIITPVAIAVLKWRPISRCWPEEISS
jgi:hypothetical protein